MSARIVVVTGTDTEVGKTTVGVGLVTLLAARGRNVLAIKPVESGCAETPGPDEDGVRLARAIGQDEPRQALTRLRKPVAPPVAADEEGVALDHRAWCDRIRALAEDREIVLVEGAGGLFSPLTWEATTRDLATTLGASTLVVAADRLGCINHVLLTVEALRAEDVEMLGVVFSAPETPDESTGANAAALGRFAPDLRTASVPRLADPTDAVAHLNPVADWTDDR